MTEEIRDLDAKLRSDEAARYRVERNQARERVAELTARVAELEPVRLELAVLKANATRPDPFVNTEDVVRLGLGDVTWADDGTAVGLDAALDAVAKAKPYLLASHAQQLQQDRFAATWGRHPRAQATQGDGASDDPDAGTPSGAPVGSHRKNQDALDQEYLRTVYPALRGASTYRYPQ